MCGYKKVITYKKQSIRRDVYDLYSLELHKVCVKFEPNPA